MQKDASLGTTETWFQWFNDIHKHARHVTNFSPIESEASHMLSRLSRPLQIHAMAVIRNGYDNARYSLYS
eukprot:2421405-Amphidinium_carterae.1